MKNIAQLTQKMEFFLYDMLMFFSFFPSRRDLIVSSPSLQPYFLTYMHLITVRELYNHNNSNLIRFRDQNTAGLKC